MKNISFLVFSLVLTAISCKSARIAQTETPKPKSQTELLNHLITNQVSAEWFSSKARIVFDDGYISESFSANIRMRKDSMIWMNFTKFGFEGGRMLITPDSTFFIDRLNSQVHMESFAQFQNTYNLPVNFQGLQAILLGNPVFFSKNTDSEIDSMRYKLSQKTERLEANYWLDPVNFYLLEFSIREFQNPRKLTVVSSDYQKLKGKQKFSYFRTINLTTPNSFDLKPEIEFSKLEIDIPKSMDFNIPPQYERVD